MIAFGHEKAFRDRGSGFMNTRPFEKKSKHKPDDWINSTIDIAVNILSHRIETINNYLKNSMKVNELITRELLGRTIWKIASFDFD